MIPESRLEQYAVYHSDGVGVMFLRRSEVVTIKSCDSRDFSGLLRQVPPSAELGLHFRMATSGPVDDAMAHPFPIADKALMHNGVIPGFGGELESDTSHFARTLYNVTLGDLSDMGKVLEKYAASSRFLLADPKAGFQQFGKWCESEETSKGFVYYSSDPDPLEGYRYGRWDENDALPPWEMGRYRDVWTWLQDHPDEAAGMLEELWWADRFGEE